MTKTIGRNEFIDDMTEAGFGFSYEGAEALFDYLEQLEDDCGIEISYDPIAFGCDYTEYENLEAYNDEYDEVEDIEEIRDFTTVIEIKGTESFIIQVY